jgi:cytochrome-b5 reductase
MSSAVFLMTPGSNISSTFTTVQVIKEVLKNPEDKTKISLIFANETVEDILLKSTLDKLVKEHSNFKVTYVLSKPPTRYTS